MFENWLTWAVIAVMLFIVEIVSPSVFFFACLGMAAALSSISTVFQVQWLPWIVFVVFSIVFAVLSRPMANKFFKSPSRPANIDALIGQKAYVVEEIKPEKFGRVKIEGEEWLAESNETLQKGIWVKIKGINGTKLNVTGEDI